MQKAYLLILTILVTLVSCQEQEVNPFVDKKIIENIRARKAPKPIENIAIISDNDVFFYSNVNDDPIRLTSTHLEKKTHIKLSHNYEKIAYLNEMGSPVIINNQGEIIAELPEYTKIKQMGWSYDDATLYMLIGNEIVFYGPEINLPIISLEPFEQVLSAVITRDNDLLYIKSFHPYYNRSNELFIKTSDGEEMVVKQSSDVSHDMLRVNLSKDGEHFILAHGYYSKPPLCKEITIYKLFETYPETVRKVNYGDFLDPQYDGYSKYILTGKRKEGGSGAYVIAEFTFDDFLTDDENNDPTRDKEFEEIKSASDIWIDWR